MSVTIYCAHSLSLAKQYSKYEKNPKNSIILIHYLRGISMLSKDFVLNERFKLIKKIGNGGMGEVWIAEDTLLERYVAIKSNSDTSRKMKAVFFDEAKTGAKLVGHPNIVSVLDYGEYSDTISGFDCDFIVMELVSGIDVNHFIDNHREEMDEESYILICLYIVWEVLKAITYSHERNIVHRDIKPANIFLSDFGVTKIGDFGLAKGSNVLTRSHTVKGFRSAPYVSPEALNNKKHNYKSDIYQLGCTIFHMLSGEYLFDVNNESSMIMAHLNVVPRSLSDVSEIIDDEISEVVFKMVSKKRGDRPELWKVNDVIVKMLQNQFDIDLIVNVNNIQQMKEIAEIMSLDEELDIGIYSYSFPDFSDCFSRLLRVISQKKICKYIRVRKTNEKVHRATV